MSTADGRTQGLDCIVAATGLRADRFLQRIKGVGRGGISLGEVLVPRPSAYLADALSAFPSLFMLNGPDGPVGNFSLIDDRGIRSAWPSTFTRFRQATAAPDLSAYELIR